MDGHAKDRHSCLSTSLRTVLPLVWLPILLLLIAGPASAAKVSRSAYWVFLKDRPQVMTTPTYVHPHALERRRIRGTLGVSGEFDLPVSDAYRKTILAVPGVALRGESR